MEPETNGSEGYYTSVDTTVWTFSKKCYLQVATSLTLSSGLSRIFKVIHGAPSVEIVISKCPSKAMTLVYKNGSVEDGSRSNGKNTSATYLRLRN
jgi:hypothetical protein